MYKKYPWWKYYLFHPVEFLIVCIGVCIALAWNWIEWREDELSRVVNTARNIFKRIGLWK